MWPYDYSRENETPLLWVSEGFTNYYGVVGVYRAGLMTPEQFVAPCRRCGHGCREHAGTRLYFARGRVGFDLGGYDTPTAFGISYYTQGQNLAALLDLSIRNDTDGRSSLDDVMRTLYSDFYKQRPRIYDRGHDRQSSTALTKKDYHDFYNRYVFWTEVPDYDQHLRLRRLRVRTKVRAVAGTGLWHTVPQRRALRQLDRARLGRRGNRPSRRRRHHQDRQRRAPPARFPDDRRQDGQSARSTATAPRRRYRSRSVRVTAPYSH